MSLRTVDAARYVLPLREGGSVPVLVEGNDMGMYVVKLRRAGQGPKALVAELLAGEMARQLGLPVPELVFVAVDRALAASEPDPELCQPLEASAGLNLGMDFLPGSITFDPVASPLPDSALASAIVLFDAFVANVDRTPRNPNLLVWHRRLWMIDHGASLYFHHGWSPAYALEGADDPFTEVKHHVLLPLAASLARASEQLARVLTHPLFERLVAEIPESWLADDRAFEGASQQRVAYVEWLSARARALPLLLEEAERERALLG